MRNQEKRKLVFYVFKILVILSAIYFATYAWFVNYEQAEFGDLEISTNQANNVEIAINSPEQWDSNGNLVLEEGFKFNDEVTSNGVVFYKANAKQESGYPINFIPAVINEDYLEFKVFFKVDVSSGIFLEDTSIVYPAAGQNIENLIGSPNVVRVSASGNFSRDLIAGAVRVGVVENKLINGNWIPNDYANIVWAPNKGYEVREQNGQYFPYLNSERRQNYTYMDITSPDVFTETNVSNIKDNLNARFNDQSAYGDPMLTYVSIDPEEENNNIGSVTIRVWIEGNDRETISALKGGIFKIKLNFLALNKQFNETLLDVSVNKTTNQITGFTSAMEYSTNLGNTWNKNLYTTFDNNTTVFVRYSETQNYFASDYVVLNF
ncbi:MAG: hypothetical protein PHO63_02965 [Bacilli bacterium]|nr:hypothetical protein [Bacilli bacterium]MDD4808907.1 hypothetical protein [Bacilli bacterium]